MARNEAYQKAENQIEQALAQNARELNLSGTREQPNNLIELPELLAELTELEWLNLDFNQLTSLPGWLGKLLKLQSLTVRNNQLTELPESIQQLKNLRTLNLSANRLRTLPASIGQLRALETLDLIDNELSQLPKSVGELIKLKSLSLSGNQLSELPSLAELELLQRLELSRNQFTVMSEWLGKLRQLNFLVITHNQLRAMPNSIGELSKLQRLDLEDNKLSSLPESIGQLTRLQWLDVSKNRLKSLPTSMSKLRSLDRLFLHENSELGLSADILGATFYDEMAGKKPASPRAILAFYFGQQKQTAKPLNEVKLLLVGHGRVGKTSLSKALRGVPHDDKEPETPGIERYPLPLLAKRSSITAHIWDFGGQEFLHQTHQFFFSERSIYVVVLTGRQGHPMQEAEYWLRLIRTYGVGSPVVIALNQIKAHPFTIDEHFLRETYPEVKAVVMTDCRPRVGIEQLRTLLGKLAAEMPSVRERIDPAWARVRGRLENMPESFVTFARYREICVEEGVQKPETQETLATILDCLGIALNYRGDPRLRDTSVLKPRWLVDGIYTILRWLHKHNTNGELRLNDFPKALSNKKTYPPAMHRFLLALMEKFELCFPLESDEGIYLVPGLLDANQPLELKKFMGRDARRIQFRYEDVRPPGLLPRFIVRSHTLSEGQPRWLRGAVLIRNQARALVRADHEGRVTDVFALGEVSDRVWLTEFILSEMRVLNDKLPVRTFVESEGQQGAWTELELLREAARNEEATRTERMADGVTVMVDVKQTLRDVESPEASMPGNNRMPLFICYAHANERTVKQLIPNLKVLARRGYIEAWRDTDLVPGEDWDETIKDRLSNAQIILFMVSTDFLASKYITEQERPLAFALMKEKKALVIPILLSPCSWREEDFARLEKLPRKDDVISSFTASQRLGPC
ncbi:MAG TPA: COR domain-containing protein [Pyrinomonadaceae bacterium]|jgi:internalin A